MSDPRVNGTETHDRLRFFNGGEIGDVWVAEEAVIAARHGGMARSLRQPRHRPSDSPGESADAENLAVDMTLALTTHVDPPGQLENEEQWPIGLREAFCARQAPAAAPGGR